MHRKLVNRGDKTRGICETCRNTVSATFDYRTLTLEDGTPVEGVMLANCDRCGEQIAMAPQSSPLLRAAMESRNEKRQAEKKARSTVRIPRVLADFARWLLAEVHAPEPERFDLLVKAFVMALEGASEKRRADIMRKLGHISSPVLEQPCDYSVSLYFPDQLWHYLEKLQAEAGLRNTSELVRRIFLLIESDRRAEAELRKLVLIGQ